MKPKSEIKNGWYLQFKQSLAVRAGVLLLCLTALVLAVGDSAGAETQATAIPFSDIGAKATVDYKGDALGITATSDGARLRCGFQKLEGHATSKGLWLESTEPGAEGKLRMVATAVSRNAMVGSSRCDDRTAPRTVPTTTLPATGTVSVGDKLVRFTRPGVTEEYSVSVDGVRQDFVIAAPPAGAGDLRVELALGGARAEAMAGGAKLKLDGSSRALVYSRLRVEDAAGRELTARLEVLSAERLAVSVADANATYPVRIDPIFSDADWVSLGSGMNDAVCALVVSGNNLYAGGIFTNAGGVSANRIAKWDGSAWSALGSGMDNNVLALAVNGTNLYAGGYFTTAGGVSATNIAKWNGSTWSALGSGMSGSFPCVFALAVSGTNLYAGGRFTTAGGVPAAYIAKWNGNNWSALGSGMSINVYALAVSGTDLYAGGNFTTAGGVAANRIAKWDGSAWSALGSGLGSGLGGSSSLYVYALAVSGSNLYAGGVFTTAGGVRATNIAKWDGNAWSALGSGMNFDVHALGVIGTDLYVGGDFSTAGGVPANYIAKWDGSVWSALGSGMNSSVIALTADRAGHLFVGEGLSLYGTNGLPYIAQANLGSAPTVLTPPQSQTAEDGCVVNLAARVTGFPPPTFQWFFNDNAIADCTNRVLCLSGIQATNVGAYTLVVSNANGAITSPPALLNVIPLVERRPVPALNLLGETGSALNVEYADALASPVNWLPLDTVNLTAAPQLYFDISAPLPTARFYRVWQTGTPTVLPSLNLPFLVPAITLTGNIGNSLRLDYINQFGPTNAWVSLATVTLTNTSQLYFDVTAPGQPQRLYRIVPAP
jgi:hypothetical protein